jgi:hypothetical protein
MRELSLSADAKCDLRSTNIIYIRRKWSTILPQNINNYNINSISQISFIHASVLDPESSPDL